MNWSFDSPLVRFGVTGTLIALFGLADRLARRAGGEPLRAVARPPRWLGPVIFVSILVFYATIRPFGGAVLGGAGNVAGIALALLAMALRWASRHGVRGVRQPDVAVRMLFYVALPLAAGVPSGWLTLTLPAVATSAWWCRREDALLREAHGEAWDERVRSSAHWVPGIW
jgi:protein-S-isoprenylcysteine O-methyltransferase Ste14